KQTPRKTPAHQFQQLGQCRNRAGFALKADGIYTPPSPGKPKGQGAVHPKENGGHRENGEEEDRLAAKNRPEHTRIPDRREPGPIDQEVSRQAQYDEARDDDDNSDRDGSSWHTRSLVCSSCSWPSDGVALGAADESAADLN